MAVLKSIFLSAILLAGASANAFSAIDQEKWTALLQKTVNQGEIRSLGNGEEIRYLERLRAGEEFGAYYAEYFSLYGYSTPMGFAPSLLYVSSEHWSMNADGNWVIEQLIYQVTLQAKVFQILHRQMIQTPERRLVGEKAYPVGKPESEEEQKRWLETITPWL